MIKKVIAKSQLYRNIKAILLHARTLAIGAVNFIMVEAYWQVGKRIVEEEQKGKKTSRIRRISYLQFIRTFD